jgi:hypothetical protein
MTPQKLHAALGHIKAVHIIPRASETCFSAPLSYIKYTDMRNNKAALTNKTNVGHVSAYKLCFQL